MRTALLFVITAIAASPALSPDQSNGLVKRNLNSWLGATWDHSFGGIFQKKSNVTSSFEAKSASLTDTQVKQATTAIRRALEGFTRDNDALITAICTKSGEQMRNITQCYQNQFKRTLAHDITGLAATSLDNLLTGLSMSPEIFDATNVHNALSIMYCDDIALLETIGGRTKAELTKMAAAYRQKYDSDMLADIKYYTRGDFGKFIVAMIANKRIENTLEPIDIEPFYQVSDLDAAAGFDAFKDAQHLFDVLGSDIPGNKFEVWMKIFTTRSYEHIEKISNAYKNLFSAELGQTIRYQWTSHLSDDVMRCFLVIHNREKWLADRFYKTIVSIRPYNEEQIRLTYFAREVILGDLIKQEYKAVYGTSVVADIKSHEWGPKLKHAMITAIGE